ncbi:MAG: extracellular solute-binding protein [Anaerolineae bacterium]|nr:extracellular solute-binding protein [Anaerolineae bacterium]MDW8099787.1 extracellular solute-binding protein [Anaerolineae bacterium]
MARKLNRREFLRISAASAGALALAACAPQAAPSAPAPTTPLAAPTEATATPAASPVPAQRCQMDWNPTFPPPFKVYDPPVEVSVIWNPGLTFPEGMSWNNNPMYNRVVEYTGIKFTIHWEAYGELRDQKLAADLAAGTLPDAFHAAGLFFEELIDNDAIEDIKEIWEATASPLTKEKKMYPDYKWWKPVLRNGKLYGIPFTWGPAYNVDNLCFIRQDWLDQLGLKAPETVEEWGTVAKAFRDAGLCQFGISACKRLVTWFQSLDPVFGAFGVMPTCWVKAEDGTLKYDSISPAVKDALAVIRQWYEEGLIDPDFYTYNEGDAAGHIAASKVGIFTAPWWHGGAQVKLEQENPGMKLALIPYPKGPQGKQGRRASAEVQSQVVFKKGLDPIKIEACINNLNWHIEMHVNWQKYQQYGEWRNSHAFVEGLEWVWDENCELKDGPVVMPMTYTWMDTIDFGFPYMVYPTYQVEPFRDIQEWMKEDPAKLNKAQRFLIKNPIVLREAEYYTKVFDTLNVQIINEFFGNPTDAMQKLLPDLNTLESEVFTNIVIGNEPLDRFDSFVEEWWEKGGEQVTADVNAWYKATFG